MPETTDFSVVRRPEPTAPRRLEPLATLPVFFKLDGKRVVIAGGSEAAAWKAELVAAAGAVVDIYATEPCEELVALACSYGPPPTCGEGAGVGGSNSRASLFFTPPPTPPHQWEGSIASRIVVHRRDWVEADLDGAALAIGAIADETEAARFAEAARNMGVPFNVIDRPDLCAFQFGAIVNRSPLVVAVSTDGGAPMLAQSIRSDIEALLPAGFRGWAGAAKRWRGLLKQRGLAFVDRRRFWERFTALARREHNRAPADNDMEALIAEVTTGGAGRASIGEVKLVGAGPGDPELLTLAAVRALRSADVILYDDLVAPEVLEFARREARRMLVGKTGHKPSCSQQEINALMVSLARAGRRVVRLKAGDPLIFARARDEIDALTAVGIPVEIIPGISAAQGAAASLRTPLTERGVARQVQLVTGHSHDGRLPDDLDWQALADPQTTIAIYMPHRTLRQFCERLLAAGVAQSRPTVAVFNATRPEQEVVRTTLADLADRVSERQRMGPCVVLIGNVLRDAQDQSRSVERAAAGKGDAFTNAAGSRQLAAQ